MLEKSFQKLLGMKKSLDASWLRNKAISHNIANVNTPNYKREVVNFDKVLKSYMENGGTTNMKKTNSLHMDSPGSSFEPSISKIRNTSFREDNNNVDIDIEMSERAKNEIKYNAVITQMNSEFLKLKMAIKGGR